MSSFRMMARHKESKKTYDVWCLDDYFGKRKYGYIFNADDGENMAMTEQEFYEQYEPSEDEFNPVSNVLTSEDKNG